MQAIANKEGMMGKSLGDALRELWESVTQVGKVICCDMKVWVRRITKRRK